MSRRVLWATLLLGTVAVTALVVWTGAPGEARGSTLSRGPGGWLAARRYLEARGTEVKLLNHPLDHFGDRGVLVVTFPWQVGALSDPSDALADHLRRGGDLVVGYSGGMTALAELVALDALGGELREIRIPSLQPRAWRRFVHAEWTLRPARDWKPARPLRLWAPRAVPDLPQGAQVLFRGPRGEAAVFAFRRYGSRVVVLPTDLFSNARLAEAGNADLLETLRRDLGRTWSFDEYHHGLAAPEVVDTRVSGPVLDLLLAHLALLYLLAVWVLARRFGPAWREIPAVAGSTASFLLGLGALHHRMGHYQEAARLLLRRTRELDRDLAVPETLARRADVADTPRELVDLARSLVRLRRGKPAMEGEK
jgi:hypothetical protein